MAKFKTAMGKVVDMNALVAKNEKTRAVGNMRVNARGDSIDSNNRIVRSATSKVNDAYSKTVGNRSAQPQAHTNKKPIDNKPKINLEELTPFERELEESMDQDLEIEKIKAKETKDGK
jgi:hypothetical protein